MPSPSMLQSCKTTSSSPAAPTRPWSAALSRGNYGIALPTGSALCKKIDETLLDITAHDTYEELYSKYFGGANSR